MRIINNINSIPEFETLLESNPGVVIIKIGAEWCAPCRLITPYVTERFSQMPETTIQPVIVDADECVDFYALMKRKKMLPGIPAIFAYIKGNTTFVPDFHVIGTDLALLDAFFVKCAKTNTLQK